MAWRVDRSTQSIPSRISSPTHPKRKAGEADAVGDGAELLPDGYDDDQHQEGTMGHGGGSPRGPPTRAWGHHKRPRPLPPQVPPFALPTPRCVGGEELCVCERERQCNVHPN